MGTGEDEEEGGSGHGPSSCWVRCVARYCCVVCYTLEDEEELDVLRNAESLDSPVELNPLDGNAAAAAEARGEEWVRSATWRITAFGINTFAALYVISTTVYVLELLGELPIDSTVPSALWTLYRCDDGAYSFVAVDGRCEDEVLSPFVSFYFVIISLSTVGYGDYSPNHTVSRLVIVIFIFLGLAAFASATSEFVAILNLKTSSPSVYLPKASIQKNALLQEDDESAL